VVFVTAKSSAVSISNAPAASGRDAAAVRPSGFPVLKSSDDARAGVERPSVVVATNGSSFTAIDLKFLRMLWFLCRFDDREWVARLTVARRGRQRITTQVKFAFSAGRQDLLV